MLGFSFCVFAHELITIALATFQRQHDFVFNKSYQDSLRLVGIIDSIVSTLNFHRSKKKALLRKPLNLFSTVVRQSLFFLSLFNKVNGCFGSNQVVKNVLAKVRFGDLCVLATTN